MGRSDREMMDIVVKHNLEEVKENSRAKEEKPRLAINPQRGKCDVKLGGVRFQKGSERRSGRKGGEVRERNASRES